MTWHTAIVDLTIPRCYASNGQFSKCFKLVAPRFHLFHLLDQWHQIRRQLWLELVLQVQLACLGFHRR